MGRKPNISAAASRAAEETTDSPAIQPTEPKGAKFVSVACKIPNGLVLQLCRETEQSEETNVGIRVRKVYQKTGDVFVVAGPAYPNGQVPEGFPDRPLTVGGYAITSNCPKEFFDEWMRQNATAPFVLGKQIMAAADIGRLQDIAKEHRNVQSGFEAMNPKGDPRDPKPISSAIGKVVRADVGGGGTRDYQPPM